jgi:hypothetical protein
MLYATSALHEGTSFLRPSHFMIASTCFATHRGGYALETSSTYRTIVQLPRCQPQCQDFPRPPMSCSQQSDRRISIEQWRREEQEPESEMPKSSIDVVVRCAQGIIGCCDTLRFQISCFVEVRIEFGAISDSQLRRSRVVGGQILSQANSVKAEIRSTRFEHDISYRIDSTSWVSDGVKFHRSVRVRPGSFKRRAK